MPAFTVNRGYPYSIPTDPANVPAALQALAEAIDDDVCTLTNNVMGRPVSQFRGTVSFTNHTPAYPLDAPPFPYVPRIPFDTTDFNTANVTMQAQEVNNRLLFPEDPGFYFALATLKVPTLTAATSMVYMDLQLRRGDATNPTAAATLLSRTSNSIAVETFDRNVRVLSVAVGCFMNGTTDAFSVEFNVDTNPDIGTYTLSDRSITILKMTQS